MAARALMAVLVLGALTVSWSTRSLRAATHEDRAASQLRWLGRAETQFRNGVLGDARPVRTYLISYPRKITESDTWLFTVGEALKLRLRL
jgi:hypothetical protein